VLLSGPRTPSAGCAPAGAKLALDFTQRTVAPEIGPELSAGLEVRPHAQLPGVVTKNAVSVQPEPSGKRIVHLDKPTLVLELGAVRSLCRDADSPKAK